MIDQHLIIDEGCEGYNYDEKISVNKFLQLIHEIIASKEEIKNAPESDFGYM
jgi:hypothetical protein